MNRAAVHFLLHQYLICLISNIKNYFIDKSQIYLIKDK